jgi:hypothetical protein
MGWQKDGMAERWDGRKMGWQKDGRPARVFIFLPYIFLPKLDGAR